MIYREEKGSPLTIQEMDSNFRKLAEGVKELNVDRYQFHLGRLYTSKDKDIWHSASSTYGFNQEDQGNQYLVDSNSNPKNNIPTLLTAPYDCKISKIELKGRGSSQDVTWLFSVTSTNKEQSDDAINLYNTLKPITIPANEYKQVFVAKLGTHINEKFIIKEGNSILLLWKRLSVLGYLHQATISIELIKVNNLEK